MYDSSEVALISSHNVCLYVELTDMSLVLRKSDFCTCESKAADSCAVTAQLISGFVFAT